MMNFLEKLCLLMEKNNLNKNSLSKACGIPYTTIDGWYKKGFENMTLVSLRKLASYFNTTLDFWARDDWSAETTTFSPATNTMALNALEAELIATYRELNDEGKEKLRERSKELVELGYVIKRNARELA